MNRFSKILFNAFRRDYGRLDSHPENQQQRKRLTDWIFARMKLVEARLK